MAGSSRISQKRIKSFQQRFYGISVASFFLITTFVLLSALGQNQDPRRQAARPSMRTTSCSEFSRSWGEWCVYTFTDDQPESLLPMSQTSGVTAWFRDGSWNLVASGLLQESSAQAQALYRFETSDRYGLANWQLVQGTRAGGALVDGSDVIDQVGTPGNILTSTLNPDVVPVEALSITTDESSDCCDTLFFTAEQLGSDGRTASSIHRVSLLPWDAARVEQVNQTDANSAALIAAELIEQGVDPEGISAARAIGDAMSGTFYMLFSEGRERSQISLAKSSWVNTPYSVTERNLFGSQPVLNPHVLRDRAGTYHAFYTLADAPTEIWSARSDRITGPFSRHRVVLAVPEGVGIKQLSAPYLVCNEIIDQWQLYFIGVSDAGEQHLHTGFLSRGCNQPPVL